MCGATIAPMSTFRRRSRIGYIAIIAMAGTPACEERITIVGAMAYGASGFHSAVACKTYVLFSLRL